MAEQPKNKASAKKGPVQGKRKISDEYQEDEIFQAPVITREPSSRQCKLGSNVVLRISASGKPLPSYQWFHNGKKISGANTDRLTISKARRASAGAYHCEAKNHVGKAVSRQCMVSFYLSKVPKLVIEPKDAKVVEGKPITLKVVTNNPAEFKEFQVFWVFNGMRIKGARGLELQIAAGKKKYEGEYKAMISVGSGLETSNVAKVTIVPATAAPAAPAPEKIEGLELGNGTAVETEHEGTMVGKLPELSVSAPEPEKPSAEDWNDFLFDPEDEGGAEIAEPEDKTRDFDSRSIKMSADESVAAALVASQAAAEDSTREFDSRGIKMTAAEADELLGVKELNPIQAIERLKEEIEKSKLIEAEKSKSMSIDAPLKPAAVEQWETFSFEDEEEEANEEESVLEMPEEGADATELASDDSFERLSETQKSVKIRELMEQMDAGEEAQLEEAARIAAARAEAKKDPIETVLEAKEPEELQSSDTNPGLVEVVGSDGFTGAIDLLKAVEAKDAGEAADAELAFDPDPVPEPVAPVKKISDAPARRPRANPKLVKKREFLESFLAKWQERHARNGKRAA